MQGHLIFEAGNRRFVALPRDHRNGVKCGGCALFCQRVDAPHIKCPVDGAGNLVCRLGHGLTWKRIGWPAWTKSAAGTPRPQEETGVTDPGYRKQEVAV